MAALLVGDGRLTCRFPLCFMLGLGLNGGLSASAPGMGRAHAWCVLVCGPACANPLCACLLVLQVPTSSHTTSEPQPSPACLHAKRRAGEPAAVRRRHMRRQLQISPMT